MIKPRIAISALVLSASTLVGIALNEGYTDNAVIPVKGDVPTVGFGTTQGVRMGDKTTPPRALVRLLADANQYSKAVKRCAPVPMYQYEFDAWVDFTYNVGPTAFCHSTAAKKLNAEDYAGACKEIMKWVYFKGRRLRGLEIRRESEFKTCMGGKS